MRTVALRAVLLCGAALSGCTAPAADSGAVRFATFNTSLNRPVAGRLIEDLRSGEDQQARKIAEILQRVRPAVVLLNEFDFDAQQAAWELFRDLYLARSQQGAEPIDYPFVYLAPSNTGVPSGFDLDGEGTNDGPGDAYGFGRFPGQYGMLLLSQYPIDVEGVRTFQSFLWKDMPGALLPEDFYSAEAAAVLRLSSKSHWDVPVEVDGRTVHMLCAHPTPPVFDGPEDRNGRRNHDEIRFWADYVTPGSGDYIVDDRGVRGGLEAGAEFVIVGDYNSDPFDGDSVEGAMQRLLSAPRVREEPVPTSAGAVEASAEQGGVNASHRGPAAHDTSDFGDGGSGNLRVDYCLPSIGLEVLGAGVFWPERADPLSRLTGSGSETPSSDHRLVYIDVR